MSNSEFHFNELLAQILVRTDKMLAESSNVIPYGLLLTDNGKIEIIIAVDISDKLSECLEFIQNTLKKNLEEKQYVAAAVVFADYDNMEIISLLENNENYCLKVLFPVMNIEDQLKIDTTKIKTEEGSVYIFPFIS